MAKPLTRVLRFLANKMGYDLLRLQKTTIHPEAKSGLGRGGGFDAFEPVVPRPVKSFDIIFRSCARVEIHGQANRKRIVDAPKGELMARCLNGLVRSINKAIPVAGDTRISLTVLDDHSSPESVATIKAVLATAQCPTAFQALETSGNGPSVGSALRHARAHCADVVYFVEDDYLHAEHAVTEMIHGFGRLAATLKLKDISLFPCDYPDRYRHVEPTLVLLGGTQHWRTVPNSTFTVVTKRGLLEKYWDFYIGLEGYGVNPAVTEATTIGRVNETVPCLAPVGSLAVHVQHFDTISPFVDWRQWWHDAALSGT
ncbi:MAG: hypothetical protein VW338_07835 [Rhodospirillaceae bacterium]